MNRQEMDTLVRKWEKYFDPISYQAHFSATQYDDRSAAINYAMIREYKPKVVLEFGSHKGRCTRDIFQALRDNGGEFIFQSYEIEDGLRQMAQRGMDEEFGKDVFTIGGDVMKGELPKDIDYLFLDHAHDDAMNHWVFDYLLPNHCKDGCIVQIHDLPLSGDWDIKINPWNEASLIKEKHVDGTLPLEKIYWTYEEGYRWESTWWVYRKSV